MADAGDLLIEIGMDFQKLQPLEQIEKFHKASSFVLEE